MTTTEPSPAAADTQAARPDEFAESIRTFRGIGNGLLLSAFLWAIIGAVVYVVVR